MTERSLIGIVLASATSILGIAVVFIVVTSRARDRDRQTQLVELRPLLEKAIAEANRYAVDFDFATALSQLDKIEKKIRSADHGNPHLQWRLDDALAEVRAAEEDYAAKIDRGYEVFEGRLLSQIQKRRILAERLAQERLDEEQHLAEERHREKEVERGQLKKEAEQQLAEEEKRKEASVREQAAEQKPGRRGSRLPDYTVLKDRTIDAGAAKVEVELDVLVSGVLTESNLRGLLLHLLEPVKARTGSYAVYKHPTAVYISAYTSKETAESGAGQWVAMLRWYESENRRVPYINVRKHLLKPKAPQIRFGLSEELQRELFQETIRAEWRAAFEADKREPLLDPANLGYSEQAAEEQSERNTALERRLLAKYKKEIADRYGLTTEQVEDICLQGLVDNWTFPKFPEEQ